MSNHVTRQEESSRLDDYQGTIDMDLREVGFDEVLGRHSIDASLGMIVVGRDFVHSTQLADVDHDLDPLASRLAVCHEVGLYQRVGNGGTWQMLEVSRSFMGDKHEPSGIGAELSVDQLQLVQSSLASLLAAKNNLTLPRLGKDLKRLS